MQVSFDEVVYVTPFELVVQRCMNVQEGLTQLVQSGGNDQMLVMCEQVVSLHAECVRMHDSKVLTPSEDADYLQSWFIHLSEQMSAIELCPCMATMLEQSKLLVS